MQVSSEFTGDRMGMLGQLEGSVMFVGTINWLECVKELRLYDDTIFDFG